MSLRNRLLGAALVLALAAPAATAAEADGAGLHQDALACLGAADPACAVNRFRQAARAGHAPAMLALAALHARGTDGLDADADEAHYWLQMAAEWGSATARRLLGETEVIARLRAYPLAPAGTTPGADSATGSAPAAPRAAGADPGFPGTEGSHPGTGADDPGGERAEAPATARPVPAEGRASAPDRDGRVPGAGSEPSADLATEGEETRAEDAPEPGRDESLPAPPDTSARAPGTNGDTAAPEPAGDAGRPGPAAGRASPRGSTEPAAPRAEPEPQPARPAAPRYTLQLAGAYRRAGLERLVETLDIADEARIETVSRGGKPWFRLVCGRFPDPAAARARAAAFEGRLPERPWVRPVSAR